MRIKDELVGPIRVRSNSGLCEVGRLIVHPDYQNQGIGKQLMYHMECAFGNAEAFHLFTGHLSEKNLAFYSKLGYRELRREHINAQMTLVHIEKPNEQVSVAMESLLIA